MTSASFRKTAVDNILKKEDLTRDASIAITKSVTKRLIDLILSTLMLIVTSPFFAIISVTIKLEDRGPVFYRQERWGRGGTKFRIRKFRTMTEDSDSKYGVRQAKENDSRITKVGKVLRATGLDELPQITHIFLGDMSFVGPRPLAVGEIVQNERGGGIKYENIPGFWERLSVKPGLTSLSTVYRPKDLSPKDKYRYDLIYIHTHTIWLDLKLIALSFWISLRGKWESRVNKL